MNYNPRTDGDKALFNSIVKKLQPPNGNVKSYPDKNGKFWTKCPFHGGKDENSLSFNLKGYECCKCKASGSISDLGKRLGIKHYLSHSKKLFTGITLQQYAEASELPEDFLKSLYIYERKKMEIPRLFIPYFNKDGEKIATRICQSLNGSDPYTWQNGGHPALYGLWRTKEPLHNCKENREIPKKIILVDGEINAQILWYYGCQAIGVPGVRTWKSEWKEHIKDFEVYIWQEPDPQGTQFVEKIGEDIPEIKILCPPNGIKKMSEIHIAGDNVLEMIEEMMETAIPYSEIQKEKIKKEYQEITKNAKIFADQDILEEVKEYCKKLGVVGEEKHILLIYVAVTSRILEKPVSLAIKGASSVGKSHILKNVLSLFPKSAYLDTSSMSDKALFYTEENFEHRFIIFYENAGISSEFLSYIIRSLLSEHEIKHMTVISGDHGIEGKTLEKKGPTGFITTTTKNKLHPENETRLLSIDVSEDPVQTKNIFRSIGERAMGSNNIPPVPDKLINYQVWIEKFGKRKVVIPYAGVLAELTEPSKVRLRRDFSILINTIKTIAILYQQQREIDENGCIIATLDDYALAYDLVIESINEGVEKLVKTIIRETVLAVEKILNSKNPLLVKEFDDEHGNLRFFIDNKTLADALGCVPSTASRRVDQAIELGYLKNLETSQGKRSMIVLGKPLPEDESVLPSPAKLKKIWDDHCNSSAIVQSQSDESGEDHG